MVQRISKILRTSLSARIVVALLLALSSGLVLREKFPTGIEGISDVGSWIIRIIKAIAAPLLFLTVVLAIVHAPKRFGFKSAARLVFFALFNSAMALLIGLSLSNYFQAGKILKTTAGIEIPAVAAQSGLFSGTERIQFWKTVSGWIPSSLVSPFVENAIIPVVLLALLIGFSMRRALEERPSKALLEVLDRLLLVCHFSLNWVIRLVPFAVFGVVLESTLKNGLAPVKGLSAYLGVALLGLLIQNIFVYLPWIKFKGRIGVREFWREAKEPVVYALGANSSLATLPLTLKALDRLKIGKEAQALGACVATNINQDGILLYEAMAVLFVAQYYGVNLSLSEQILAGLSCVLAAMGVAGVPEAGLISLALVLATVGLPTEVLPLLLSVDWIVARARSATNVMSDLTLAILVEEDKNRAR